MTAAARIKDSARGMGTSEEYLKGERGSGRRGVASSRSTFSKRGPSRRREELDEDGASVGEELIGCIARYLDEDYMESVYGHMETEATEVLTGASVGEELKHRSGRRAVYVSAYTRRTRERDRPRYGERGKRREHRRLNARLP